MSKIVTPVNVNTFVFQQWVDKTNEVIDHFDELVSVSVGNGDITIGNGFVTGVFGASKFVTYELSGGNVSASANLFISSNVSSNAHYFTINTSSHAILTSANVEIKSNNTITAIKVAGNSTSTNTTINGNTFVVNANLEVRGITFTVPSGNIAQRPTGVSNGALRYNHETSFLEVMTNGVWKYVIASPGTDTSVFVNIDATTANIVTLVAGSISGNGASITSVNAALLNGQAAAYYVDIPARLGYTPVDTATYTAADVLAKLITVDGAASALDSDLLDGQHGAYYRDANNMNAGTLPAARLGTTTAYSIGNTAVTGITVSGNKVWMSDGKSFYGDASNIGFMSAASVVLASVNNTGDFTAAGNVSAYSDERLKQNIETITNALNKVLALRGVSYIKDGKQNIGVIAQEVQKIVPEVVLEGEEYLSVMYGNLAGLFIEATKELNAKVESQRQKISELKMMIEYLAKRLDALE